MLRIKHFPVPARFCRDRCSSRSISIGLHPQTKICLSAMKSKVAVAGAGIYGASIAIQLAEQGHDVHLFDPLGILRAASAINQYRVHSGYHYPRSPETILEIIEAHSEFLHMFAPAIVSGTRHYYAIPRQYSLTSPELFEKVMNEHNLPLRQCQPPWMDFGFIDKCYEVDEHVYDPDLLRELITSRLQALGIPFERHEFSPAMRGGYDFVVWATYGLRLQPRHFRRSQISGGREILIELPFTLRGVSLIVLDGPFTAFDPYGNSERFLFGSAKHTNHWTTADSGETLPAEYAALLNGCDFVPCAATHFEAMRKDAALTVPLARDAVYCGSRFTLRVVENNCERRPQDAMVRRLSGGTACVLGQSGERGEGRSARVRARCQKWMKNLDTRSSEAATGLGECARFSPTRTRWRAFGAHGAGRWKLPLNTDPVYRSRLRPAARRLRGYAFHQVRIFR